MIAVVQVSCTDVIRKVECNIPKLYRLLRPGSSVIVFPRLIPSNSTASVKICVEHEVHVERYEDCPSLGRFALRSDGRVVAVGMISQLPSDTWVRGLKSTTPEVVEESSHASSYK